MAKYFGTDGIRAVAGSYPLTEDFVTKLGFFAAQEILKAEGIKVSQNVLPVVVIGRDSRKSGADITKWLCIGAAMAGCKVVDIGIATTPAVPCVAKHLNAVCAVVVSASHNPPEFNGIKFFTKEGRKFPQAIEGAIEDRIEKESMPAIDFKEQPVADYRPELLGVYEDFIIAGMPEKFSLNGKTIVIDCANGAAYKTAPSVFKKLGAAVISIFDRPNGSNINDDCGALHTRQMRQTVLENNAFCGISLDGDADRVIFSDEKGREMDGDDLIFTAAYELQKRKLLNDNKVVLTVMSNYGLISKLKEMGLESEIVDVGDKYVSQALDAGNLALGGESSGHIIFHGYSPSGDGILSAAQILGLIIDAGKTPGFYKDLWTRFPHTLKAVTVSEKVPLNMLAGFNEYIKECETNMRGKGRVLVRYSGTEPKLRILVEGLYENENNDIAEKISMEYALCVNRGTVCRN